MKPKHISTKPARVNVHPYVTKRITEQPKVRVESSAVRAAFARAVGLL